MNSLIIVFILLVVAPTTLWAALAIYYHVDPPWLRWCVSLAPPVVVAVSLALLPILPWVLVVWLGLLLVTTAWWLSLRAKSDRDWKTGVDVLPDVEIVADTLRIRQFRNFRYTATGDPLPRYEERTFDLTKLSSLDYFLAHWSGPAIAHSFVSFGFDDGQFLVVSVEARLQRTQSYSPLRGMFRSYELIFVLGDERDIIHLRTNIRRERVYLYRVRMPQHDVRQLLLNYLARVTMLQRQPEWYHSFTSNCTTNLFYHAHNRVPWWLAPGIFVNGLSARALYMRGLLDKTLPFNELRSRSVIGDRALSAGDAASFSQQIRTVSDLPKALGEGAGRASG
jgi:hypothetical protein